MTCPQPEVLETLLCEFRAQHAGSAPSSLNKDAAYWAACLWSTHVLNAAIDRDPRTGSPQPQLLSDLLTRIYQEISRDAAGVHDAICFPADALFRMAQHCESALKTIMAHPRQRLVRTHELRPLYRVREVDTVSMRWLARQPGTTLREKAGIRQRVLTAVRYADLRTLENRVLRRVTHDLSLLLRARLHNLDGAEASSVRRNVLETVLRLSTEGVRRSGVDEIPLNDVQRANNVLLSDSDYHCVWKVWLWLCNYRHDTQRAWESASDRLAVSTFWVLAAFLCGRYQAVCEDGFWVPGAGFGAEHFGFQPTGERSSSGKVHVRLWVDRDRTAGETRQTLVLLDLAGSTILLRFYELKGSTRFRLRDVPSRMVRLKIELEREQDPTAGGLCPIDVSYWIGSGEPQAGRPELDNLPKWFGGFLEPLLGPPPEPGTAGETGHPREQIGIDLSGVVPRIESELGTQSASVMCTGRAFDLGEHGQKWVTGSIGYWFPANTGSEWCSVPNTFEAFLRRSGTAETQATSFDRVFGELWRSVPRRPNAEIAIAVSALLPDPAHRRLRDAAGIGFSKTWLIDRGIAAAMGWQTTGSFRQAGLKEGDNLLVVDAEAGRLRVSVLRAVYDAAQVDKFGGIYWERDLRRDISLHATHLTYRAWLRAYLEFAVTKHFTPEELPNPEANRLCEALIDQGDAERCVDHQFPLRVLWPLNRTGVNFAVISSIDDQASRHASDAWIRKYGVWLKRSRMGDFVGQLTEGREGRCHVLYVGRPFQRKSVRDRLERQWKAASLPDTFLHHASGDADRLAAIGAREFLNRHAKGLLTWRDLLPELYVEMKGEGEIARTKIQESTPAYPGRLVQFVPSGLTLPRGIDEYRLPVSQGQDEDEEMLPYMARLKPPGFPLRSPLRVTMKVHYLYGEDDLRLMVDPAEGAYAPFQEVEMGWVSLVSQAPQFSEGARDRKAGSEVSPEEFERSVTEWEESIRIFQSETHVDAHRAERKKRESECIERARRLGGAGNQPTDSAIRKISKCLGYWGQDDIDITGAAMVMLERLIRDPTNEVHRSALSALIRSLDDRFKRFQRKLWRLNRPLSATAVTLRSHQQFVGNLDPRQIEAALSICEQTLQQLEAEIEHPEALAGPMGEGHRTVGEGLLYTFRNVCELLLGILLLRAVPEADEDLLDEIQAGSQRMHKLAKLLYRLDRKFPVPKASPVEKFALNQIPQRIKFENGAARARDMSDLAFSLYSYLSGYNPLRLVQLETGSETE